MKQGGKALLIICYIIKKVSYVIKTTKKTPTKT